MPLKKYFDKEFPYELCLRYEIVCTVDQKKFLQFQPKIIY